MKRNLISVVLSCFIFSALYSNEANNDYKIKYDLKKTQVYIEKEQTNLSVQNERTLEEIRIEELRLLTLEKERFNNSPSSRDCEDGQIECWDGSCVDDETECPEELSCTGNESWIADGYCDGSNNNEACQWDGGDCCGSTCISANYDCQGGTSGSSWAACLSECLDPNGNDDCCEANDCPFTCEGNGQITCWDNSCADSEDDCPEVTCADTDCGYYVTSDFYDLTCAQIESTYGYSCSVCYDDGSCPVECEDDGLITCNDGSCAEIAEDCPYQNCASTYLQNIGNGYCESDFYGLNNEDCGFDGGDCCVETAGDPPGSQGDCNNGNYGDGAYCDCLDPDYANFTSGDTCEDPIIATDGSNSADGNDEFFSYTVTEGGILTISTAGAGIDTYMYLYASCDDAAAEQYIAYNDDWGSSQYGTCPDCSYVYESYFSVGVTAGDYIIVSDDRYNSAHTPFNFTVTFEVGVEGCTDENATNYDSEANIDDGTCEFIEGCTNPNANNYNPDAYIDDGSCQYDDDLYQVVCDGGSWQYEVEWQITSVADDSVIASGGAPYSDMVAIPAGEYYINAIDTYGDGWNGNILTIDGNDFSFQYTLDTGSEGVSETFVIEAACISGDVNDDELLNVLDVVAIVNAIISEDVAGILSCGDITGDGLLNVLDVVAIVNLILSEE